MKHNQNLNINIAYRTDVPYTVRLPPTHDKKRGHFPLIEHKTRQNGENFKTGDIKYTILLN
jgi:hypothetical protein